MEKLGRQGCPISSFKKYTYNDTLKLVIPDIDIEKLKNY